MVERWRVVRRKGRPSEAPINKRYENSDYTSFYVCNLPGGAFRKELWAPCAALGKLVDIYIAGRKNAAGSFFAFIRYEKPSNPDTIAQGLCEVVCRGKKLVANIARRPRSEAPKVSKAPTANVPRPPINMATRDRRSFADVTGSKSAPTPLISIDEIKEIKGWADRTVLTGVAKSFDTLCNFPALVELEGFDIKEVKYGGGMQILFKFTSVKAAEMFKANKNIWLKWFNHVQHLDLNVDNFDRIAWVKIQGVPLLARDESTYSTIAGSLGKVLVCCSSFWNSMDISCGKVCILTSSKKRFNEELPITFFGSTRLVGVVEVDDNWTPFSPVTFPDSESDQDDDDMDFEDEEGIPDTFARNGDDREEGEFFPDEDGDGPVDGGSNGKENNNKSFNSPRETQAARGKNEACITPINAVEIPEVPSHSSNVPQTHDSNGLHSSMDSKVMREPNSILKTPLSRGPAHFTPPSRPASSPDFERGDSALKRRRTKVKVRGASSRLNSDNHFNSSRSPLRTIDLNRLAENSSNSSSADNEDPQAVRIPSPSSSGSELERTIEVGKALGFQLEKDNGVILEVLSGAGVKTGRP